MARPAAYADLRNAYKNVWLIVTPLTFDPGNSHLCISIFHQNALKQKQNLQTSFSKRVNETGIIYTLMRI